MASAPPQDFQATRTGAAFQDLIDGLSAESSPLGCASRWSAPLRNAVALMMPARAEIVMFWGPEFCALYNEAYAPTIGSKHPQAFGRPAQESWTELWDDLCPLLTRVRETGETVYAKDRPFYIERGAGGETVYFDISYSPVPEEDGSVGGVLCIVSETTKRVVAQQTALADRDRLWTLARDPFLIADKAGVWLAASPAWTDILGWSETELIGRTSEWMEHPDDRGETRQEVRELADGKETLRFENRFRGKDGQYRSFSWTAVSEGDLLYCVARDVTQRRAAAEALRQAEEDLRHAQKMETLGQLTGGVAHDFNNLLQVVTGNLEIVGRTLPPDLARARRAAESAMSGAQRAATLTQRLLAFARRQPLAPKRVDPNRLIASMSDLLHRTLGEVVEVEIVQAARVWPVEVDENQLENAILNLAINARDAMPDGGRLTIEVGNTFLDSDYAASETDVAPGQYVVLSVSDTGSGMDAETVKKAFDPFFTTKEVGRGTGLGLSMVYGFLKQSGGHVRIYSELGEGTTIKLYLPRYLGRDGEERVRIDETAPGAAMAGEVILVCEDDADVRTFSVEALGELGYEVLAAGDGPSALRVLESDPRVTMLFTDVVLPGGMTGAVLAGHATTLRPGLKVLFTTGYARNAIVHHGRLDAGVELITKPFTFAALARRVREVLDR
ncbi:PAS domain-containing protein [Sphingomonas sp. ID0503]|uniref:hybrid sensor histidine kinase/response regulator n=1 Tax=Sphingomonas sp. ID0503 TaxID=3399691 RepID=UPI003AFA13E6